MIQHNFRIVWVLHRIRRELSLDMRQKRHVAGVTQCRRDDASMLRKLLLEICRGISQVVVVATFGTPEEVVDSHVDVLGAGDALVSISRDVERNEARHYAA